MLMHYVILDGGILFYTPIKHETATIPLYVLDVFLQILSSPFFPAQNEIVNENDGRENTWKVLDKLFITFGL